MSQANDTRIMIRPWSENDSLDELTELLHRAYAYLANMGLRFHATFQDASVTKERIEAGHCFVAESDGKVIGTITYYEPWEESSLEVYARPGVAHLGQLAVEPELQKKGIATLLMRHAENFAKSRGMKMVALDTAEPARHLIEWYERMGYEFHCYHQWDVTNYRSVVMVKSL